ncbi:MULTISPECIES: hypothetical protein [unclassified Streptomyces]|jgi:hypothetical protein|uniref:hypothetical protein n=1 Tax=unclassified Streptomyces TaxID=2593676 RepID=UPI000F4E7E6C|nr:MULTISPECIES: hypothetical protein [unclassified Streptomyces]MDH6496803.1 hypothetical protein [Streptomyces sp. SAI-149]QUC56441.1 hypothetical protein IOD14_06355 [Streptomyces sp. A2-16]GLP68142.1 hypothetical protein TUSST3_47640 [Streptomyces sp. TUS-ST3]
MIDVHETLVILAVLVLTVGAGLSLAAITAGWIAPGAGRAKVLRPRVWGYGTLVAMAGIGTYLFVGPLQGPDMGHFPVAMGGMAVFFVGLYVQRRAFRPATKTSS